MALTVQELMVTIGADTGPFEKTTSGLKGKIGRLGPVLAGAAAVAGAGVAAALATAIDRARIQDRLAAQLNLTAEQSRQAGKTAGELYAGAYGESFEEVSGAVAAVMSSMDLPDDQVKAATANVLNLASAFEVDVARAAQVAGQMLTTGLASDATNAANLMTAGLQQVPAALRGDLLDAIDEYGPSFAALGYDGQAAMGMLVAASEDGMYGIDKTGDALKEFSIRATDMSDASKVAYDTLGMSQEDMTRKLLAGGDTAAEAYRQIVGGLRSIEDPAAQSQAALALFGTPLEDLGTSEIPQFLNGLVNAEQVLGNVEGAAAKIDEQLAKGTGWTQVRRQVEGAAADLGERMLPAANAVADALADNVGPALDGAAERASAVIGTVKALTGWLTDHARVIGIVAGVIAAVMLPHYAALGAAALASGAKQAAGWVVAQAGAARAAAVHSFTVARMVAGWVLMGVQSLIQAGRMAAAWLIAMGPVGWVIAAVIGLVALIVANWDTIVAATGKAWEWVTGKLGSAWDWIKRTVQAAALWVAVRLFTAWTTVKTQAGAAWDWVTTKISGAWTSIKTGVSNAVGSVRDGLASAWTTIKDAAGGAWDWILTKIGDVWIGIKSSFQALSDFVTITLPNAFSTGKDAIGAAWDALKALAAKPINFIIDTVYNGGIRKVVNKVAETVGLSTRLPELATITERAKGGYTPAGMTLVGEQGPELLDLRTPGRVYTARQTREMQRGTDAPMGGFVDEARDRLSTGLQVAKMQAGLVQSGNVGGAVSLGASVLRAGMGELKAYATRALTGLAGQLTGGGMFGDAARGAVRTLVDGVIGWAGKRDEAAATAAAATGGATGPLPPVVGGWMRPIAGGRITSEFGMRRHPITGRSKLHNGIDVSTGGGALVRAMQAGVVNFAGRMGTYGNFAQVRHGNGFETGYAHLARLLVRAGQSVTRGQGLGIEGNTGGSTGAHLHQNVRPIGGQYFNPRRLGVYDTGGWLQPGFTMAYNGTGKAERIRTAEQEADVQRRLRDGAGGGLQMPRELVVRDVDGALVGRMRVEAKGQVVAAQRQQDLRGAYNPYAVKRGY